MGVYGMPKDAGLALRFKIKGDLEDFLSITLCLSECFYEESPLRGRSNEVITYGAQSAT